MAITKNPLESFGNNVSFETSGVSKVEEVLATHDKIEEILANLSKIEERTGDLGISAVTKMPGVPHDGDISAFLVTKVPLFNEWRFDGSADDGALGVGGSDILFS